MKRIVSFLILTIVFVIILMLPSIDTPAADPHPPLRPILCYVSVVAAAGVAVSLANRRMEEKETAAE